MPLPWRITLGQALPLGVAMDSIVRKATEIGVSAIFPLESERTQVHLEGSRSDRKIEKWQTAALEAAKQMRESLAAGDRGGDLRVGLHRNRRQG